MNILFELDQSQTTVWSDTVRNVYLHLLISFFSLSSLSISICLWMSPHTVICSLMDSKSLLLAPSLRPRASDGSLHFSLRETRPGGCCQDDRILNADCGDTVATGDSSLFGFISVGGAVVVMSRSWRRAPGDKHLNYRQSVFRKV